MILVVITRLENVKGKYVVVLLAVIRTSKSDSRGLDSRQGQSVFSLLRAASISLLGLTLSKNFVGSLCTFFIHYVSEIIL